MTWIYLAKCNQKQHCRLTTSSTSWFPWWWEGIQNCSECPLQPRVSEIEVDSEYISKEKSWTFLKCCPEQNQNNRNSSRRSPKELMCHIEPPALISCSLSSWRYLDRQFHGVSKAPSPYNEPGTSWEVIDYWPAQFASTSRTLVRENYWKRTSVD